MYLSREGLFSIKHKLEARQSVTTLEYIDATLALLADRRAFDNRDYNGRDTATLTCSTLTVAHIAIRWEKYASIR